MIPLFANSAWVKTTERMVLRGGRRRKINLQVRYGIFVHPVAGLTLIDTGYGPSTTAGDQRSWALKAYNWLIPSRLNTQGSLDHALNSLGYSVADVRNVIITHFHADHVSELSRFPNARVYGRKSALVGITKCASLTNLRHGVFSELIPGDLIDRIVDVESLPTTPIPHGLGRGHDIFSDGSVITVDLPGHADGHFGLCFPRASTPLLYAVDAQWMIPALTRIPVLASWVVAQSYRDLKASADRVAAFQKAGGDVVLCHDPNQTKYDLDDARDG
jgi:glyoxylase-like metal-dependent hydrolase (beta-lactamase superfamily II)